MSFIDAQIALVFKALRETYQWDNTVIVFTSDHGYHLGEHFLWGKVTLFDIGTRVPFLVRVPVVTKPGSSSEEMVELIDLYPTFCDLAKIKPPKHLQGESLLPVLRDPAAKREKDFAYTVVTRGPKLGRAIRDQQWRYSSWPDGEELYDLGKDPTERQNLARNPEYKPQLQQLRASLDKVQERASAKR